MRIRGLRARAALLALALALLGVLAARPARADVAVTEAEAKATARQALIALRVLAYDRNLTERAKGADVSIVVVSGATAEARRDRARWQAALAMMPKVKVGGRAVRLHALEYSSERAFEAAIAERRPAAVIVLPDLAAELPAVRRVTRAHRALTISQREAAVRDGLAVGLVATDGAKDEIVINLAAARAEGVRFDAGLLQLARIVDETRR